MAKKIANNVATHFSAVQTMLKGRLPAGHRIKPALVSSIATGPSNFDPTLFVNNVVQVANLFNGLGIKNTGFRDAAISFFYSPEGQGVDFSSFSGAMRNFINKFDNNVIVSKNRMLGVLRRLSNSDLQENERAENALMFARPKALEEAYLDLGKDDYNIIDADPKVRRCFVGKIRQKQRVLIVSFGEGELEVEIARQAMGGQVIVINPIAENVKKIRQKAKQMGLKNIKVIKGDPNDIGNTLKKAGLEGKGFSKVILSEVIGELDTREFLTQIKSYAKDDYWGRDAATRVLVTTYLPANRPDYSGYERMSIQTLENIAKQTGYVLREDRTRVFSVYEDDGTEDVFVSEVSDLKQDDGFVYLELSPVGEKGVGDFTTKTQKHIIFEKQIKFPGTGHAPMSICLLPDGSMILPTQCYGLFFVNPEGKTIGKFNGRETYFPKDLPEELALDLNHWCYGNNPREVQMINDVEWDVAWRNAFNFPVSVLVDDNGDIYVGGHYDTHVSVFDKNYKFLREFEPRPDIDRGGDGHVAKLLFDNKKENIYAVCNDFGLKVLDKQGNCVENIIQIDGKDISDIAFFAFGPDDSMCVATKSKIMVFSKDKKLVYETTFPRESHVMDIALNSRGEAFLLTDAFARGAKVVVFDAKGKVIANSFVNQAVSDQAGFSMASGNSVVLLDDNTFAIGCQYSQAVKVYSLSDRNYEDVLCEAFSSNERLQRKLRKIQAINNDFKEHTDKVMLCLYNLYNREYPAELIEQIIDLFFNFSDNFSEDFEPNLLLLINILNKGPKAAVAFLKTADQFSASGGLSETNFYGFLDLARVYVTENLQGRQIPFFIELLNLARKISNSDFVFKNNLIKLILPRAADFEGREKYEIACVENALAVAKNILEFPFKQAGLTAEDSKDFFSGLSNAAKHSSQSVYDLEKVDQYFNNLRQACIDNGMPFKVFDKLSAICDLDPEIMQIYFDLFSNKKDTFVAQENFEEILLGYLSSCANHPIKPGEPTTAAKKSVFRLAAENLLNQQQTSPDVLMGLKSFSYAGLLMKQFEEHAPLMDEEIVKIIELIDPNDREMLSKLELAMGQVNKIFALGSMCIKISELSEQDQQAYYENQQYLDNFVPLALKYAKGHKELLPILKLVFLASLRGDFEKLRTDQDYFPDWIYDYFETGTELETVEKYLFKRGQFALDQAFGIDADAAKQIWNFDEEEVMAVAGRDFGDMFAALKSAYDVGFSYISDYFSESIKVVGGMAKKVGEKPPPFTLEMTEEYTDVMKSLVTTAQSWAHMRRLIEDNRGLGDVLQQVTMIPKKHIYDLLGNLALSRPKDRDVALARIDEEYQKAVFNQNLYSAAKLANAVLHPEVGVQVTLNGLLSRAKKSVKKLSAYEQAFADMDLNMPGQATPEQFRRDIVSLVQQVEENGSVVSNEEREAIKKILYEMLPLAQEIKTTLNLLADKSKNLARKMLRLKIGERQFGEQHAVEGYIDNIGTIVNGVDAHMTRLRAKDSSDPVEIMVSLAGQCLDYTSGCNSHYLTDIILNPLVKTNILRGDNGKERIIANQISLMGSLVDGNGEMIPAVLLDHTYGKWGATRYYLLSQIKHALSKTQRMGIPLAVPHNVFTKVGFWPALGFDKDAKEHEGKPPEELAKLKAEAEKKQNKQAVQMIKQALEEDRPVKSVKVQPVKMRFYPGGAPFLYTDVVGSFSWWRQQTPFSDKSNERMVLIK